MRDRNAAQRLHRRVYAARGRAGDQPCARCNKPALDWATIHGESGEDPWANYVPLCRSCHLNYDYTDERRHKIGAAQAGVSRPHYQGAGNPFSGHTHSPGARAKMSESWSGEGRKRGGDGKWASSF